MTRGTRQGRTTGPDADSSRPWSHLRLKDRARPGLRVLFVGINPGVRSAQTGHHFAGHSNRFWKLLFDAGLVPEPIGYADDDRLPDFGFGITNLIDRPSPGIDDLKPREYVDGWDRLRRKIRRWRPQTVAFVGVTVYRALRPLIQGEAGVPRGAPIGLGVQPSSIEGAQVFVLPNPSGRNANFTYAEMRDAFAALAATLNNEPGSSFRPTRGPSV